MELKIILDIMLETILMGKDRMNRRSLILAILTLVLACCAALQEKTLFARDSALPPQAPHEAPIKLKTMGSLLFWGTVVKKPDGDTFHGDHGYAQYYVPQDSRRYPLIFGTG